MGPAREPSRVIIVEIQTGMTDEKRRQWPRYAAVLWAFYECTARADLNRSHVFNQGWPPHARFHGVAGWGSIAGSQVLALWLLWRPGQQASAFP